MMRPRRVRLGLQAAGQIFMSTERASVKPKSRSSSKGAKHTMTEVERAPLSGGLVRPKRRPAVATGKTTFQFAKDLTPLQTHDLVTEGLPVVAARELMASDRKCVV